MNNFTFVLLIIAIVMSARVIETWLKQRKVAQETETDADADTMAARIEQLEERIRVLERIVTEKPYDLKREIERL